MRQQGIEPNLKQAEVTNGIPEYRAPVTSVVSADIGSRMLPGAGEKFCHDVSFACSRSAYFWILPVEVFGSGPKTTCRGALKCARLARHQAMMSAALDLAGIRLQRDEGAGRLAPFLVRLGDDRRLHHLRVAVQHLLDLERGNVLAARDDDVLRAVLDLDIAVGVHDREVAGVEPAAAERLAGRVRVLQIALHHRVAAQHHLADRRRRRPARRCIVSGSATRCAVERQVGHALPRHLRRRARRAAAPAQSSCQAHTVEGP